MKKGLLSLLFVLSMLFGVFAYAESHEITVYITVEKLTLGQGFIMEPTAIQTTKGASVAEVLEQSMPGQYMHTGTLEDNLYVTAFADAEEDVNIPDYIAEAIGEPTTRQDSEWLSEFDYCDTSGWKFNVNNEFPSVSASDYLLNDGDVIRWQFSLYGYGTDIEEYGLSDKSELIRAVANGGYSEYALDVLTRLDSSGDEVNDAYLELENGGFVEDSGYSGANLNLTAQYIQAAVTEPQIAQVGGEWSILGLARSGIDTDDGYFDRYYERVVNSIRESEGVLHERKYTEYSRVILALSAIGKNPAYAGGYDITKPLTDFDSTMKQGINGAIFALLCLNRDNDICGKYIDEIISRQLENGAFSLTKGGEADVDITAMALCALSKYADDTDIKAAIERAIQYLSDVQDSDGGFSNYGEKNSESVSQVIVALIECGISPTDDRFTKNGNSVLDHLLSYSRENGGFAHIVEGDADLMATEQALCALAALERFNSNNTSLYDMSDVEMPEECGPAMAVSVYGMSWERVLDLAECIG